LIAAAVTTVLLLVGALSFAVGLSWRRYGAQPVRVEAKVDGPGCYPRVKR